MREAFPDVTLPADNGFYTKVDRWKRIFEGQPDWSKVKKVGLQDGGTRRLNMLGMAKILCDEFSHECFAEQVEVSCSDEQYQGFITEFFNREGFWNNLPILLSKGFSLGGCCMREYIENGRVRLNFVDGECFYPLSWDNNRITGGVFSDVTARGDNYYTLFELHRLENDTVTTECRLFRSPNPNALGVRVPLSELYDMAADSVSYDSDTPFFQYFKPDISNNQQTDLPLGISVYANCTDTLKSLDTVFDSFVREYVLGRKRIIVPSSCIQTVVDTATGEVRRYFDTDDEVYQALSCDEDRALHITDNTVSLRVQEHVDGINALLNTLCAQVGLSPGTLSFDRSGGMKTAAEVISEQSKTAQTMKSNKNLLVEFIEDMCRAVFKLAVFSGELPQADYELSVGFRDNIVIDDNTLIDNNVKLVSAGLKSKLTAIMEVLHCDEETARKELERIRKENTDDFSAEGERFDPSTV